jgi:uracil-DNA glycosylase family protein
VYLPTQHALPVLRTAVQTCRGCPLYRGATQAVFGEGPPTARVMMIGEIPGDREDREGRPFVGPAGRLLDEALVAAGIDRDDVYVTNVVKHFKYTLRGKRRIHDKPTRYEIVACQPWLGAELEAVEPEAVVLLGASAAQALLGRTFRVTKDRGRDLIGEHAIAHAKHVFATVHPASVLRAPDDDARRAAKEAFMADLAEVGRALSGARGGGAPA